jgi:UDP-glucose 4-epimerase
MARAAGVGRFVYVSSSEVYGTARAAPMTETHPTFPMTVYGAGKLAGECYARSYWETYDYPTVMVRPFNAFGPRCHHEGDSGEVIPKFMLRAMAGQALLVFGDGEQTRDFTYVEDTARGILAAGHAADAIGRTINLGSGAEVTINVLAGMISNLVAGGRAEVRYEPPRPGDVLRLIADAREAEIRLGFAPQVSLQDGLNALHAWYLMEGHSPVEMLRDEIAHNWRGDVKGEASNGRSD